MLKAGQSLMLNNRLWSLRQVHPGEGRHLALEAIGASEAAAGMTRHMPALLYGDELFIEQRRGGYWYAHLQRDWQESPLGPVLYCRPVTRLELLDAHTRHPASGDLPNDFSWSYSRGAKYRGCPRAYYYHYYAAWEGWRADAPAPVQRAYLLKNLTSLSRWVGALVHESIKFAVARLRAGHPVDADDLVRQMRQRAQADYQDSRSGRYREQPNRLTGFQEHYYPTRLPKSAWAEAWERAEQLLRTFLNSALYAGLRQEPPTSFLDVEALRFFTLAGVKIWVQMDLARVEKGRVIVYDWKTGEADEAELRQQLGVYGLFIRQAWPDLGAAPIRGLAFLLAKDQLLEVNLDEAALQATQAAVSSDITRLQGLLAGPPAANLAELRRFPMIDDLAVCRGCQFRELCGRDK